MKIQYASDLHLELRDNMNYLKSNPLPVIGEILVLAGDIYYLDNPSITHLRFWDWCAEHFQYTLIVPGNHEYYNYSDIYERGDSWRWMLRNNVGYFQNQAVRIGDVAFFLTTLWSVITNPNKTIVSRSLNDYYRIKYGKRLLTPDDINALHIKCLDFLDKGLELDEKHKVVVSHHVPARSCVAPCHIDSPLTDAFCANLDKFIEHKNIDAWIYGHSHTNIDRAIGKTRIMCNQLGYVNNPCEGKNFCPGRVIEI